MPQQREFGRANIPAVAGARAIIGLSSLAGLWVLSLGNNDSGSAQVTSIVAFDGIGEVASQPGFVASGSYGRTGWPVCSQLTALTGTTTAAPPLAFRIPSGFVWRPLEPILWIPPTKVFCLWAPATNALLDFSFEIAEPGVVT